MYRTIYLCQVVVNTGLAFYLVDFVTWQRTIGETIKQSTLDHIYVQDPLLVTDIRQTWTTFTDVGYISA